jgi:hypothetical protein
VEEEESIQDIPSFIPYNLLTQVFTPYRLTVIYGYGVMLHKAVENKADNPGIKEQKPHHKNLILAYSHFKGIVSRETCIN